MATLDCDTAAAPGEGEHFPKSEGWCPPRGRLSVRRALGQEAGALGWPPRKLFSVNMWKSVGCRRWGGHSCWGWAVQLKRATMD